MELKSKKLKTVCFWLVCMVLLILFDQWTKWMAVSHLKGKEAVPIIEGVFELSYLENRGMAWGLLSGQRILFLIGSVVILAVIIYAFWKAPLTKRFRLFRTIMTVLAAGAIGNFIDRLLNGYVVDFFYFCLIDFPVFNVADCYVVTAGIAFVLSFLFYYKDEDLAVFVPGFWKNRKNRKRENM